MIDQLNELLNGPWGPLAVIIGFAGLLILLAYGLYQINLFFVRRGTHPAVVEFLNKAIALAWKAGETAVDMGQDRLRGLDKKKIADDFYDTGGDLLIHLQLRFLPFAIDLRKFVTRDQWAGWVQERFDDMTDGLQDILDQMEEEGPPEAEDGRVTIPVEPYSVKRARIDTGPEQ